MRLKPLLLTTLYSLLTTPYLLLPTPYSLLPTLIRAFPCAFRRRGVSNLLTICEAVTGAKRANPLGIL